VKIKKNYLFFNINNINQAIEAIIICKKNKMLPVICIKFFIIDGFGPDWIKELRNLLLKKFNKRDFKILVDCRKNYGLFINLVQQKIDFLQVKAEPNTLFRLKNIANKNKVTVNPKINIINLSNIKKIKSKIQKIYKA
tara:strand:- start:18 stop:431 length:414 start_codon:yes stop_codon:yes gene_type:complete